MGAKHYAHRLCWALYYGSYPVGSIDHINGDGFDNRISNLREVTHRGNTHNQKTRITNKSGCMGLP
ncbi:HNH endonuclease signature motif containing protein [Cronobacter sakazakii]|uniref:HNH endonuclease signature motif containing protein n=1 Tax=Cronobacter sakazakii TaxID=28141 RepID=UPI00355B6E00